MSSQNLLRDQVNSELKKRSRIFFTIISLSLLYLAITFIFGDSGFLRYRELNNKKNRLALEIKDLEARNNHLQTNVKQLKENPFYIEKHARENFGMARPDEYVFKYEEH